MKLFRGAARQQVVIASSGTASAAVDARDYAMFQLRLPAAFTGTTLTFTTSDAIGGTYQALSDNTGTAVSLTVAQGKDYDLPSALASAHFFKVVSGSSEGAARTLTVLKKG